ncbi:MAG: hypothetical protein Kow0079_07100 [Vicingaceae bacterium]
MKKYSLIFSLSFLFAYITNAQCTSPNLTPGSSPTCPSLSSYTTYSGSSPCAGPGFGGSGSAKIIKFCTNASADCIVLDFSGLPGSDGVSVSIYSTCTGTSSLSGYVSGSANCYSNATDAIWSSNDVTLSPNTCYYAYVWSKNGFPGGATFCTFTQTPTNDECVGAMPISTVPQTTDNYCMTPGATDPPPAALCAGSLENTAWYTFTVQNNGDVVITIDNISCYGGAGGFQIGFFSGTCGSLTNDGCSSGSGGTVTATYTGLTAGDQLYIAIDGNAGANCTYDISATNTVPLPIELTRFSASQVNNELLVSLDWITESEINNDYFTVERSKDGINYEVVDIVEGAGNSSSTKTYRTYDNNPFNGDNYYRLKQTDYDGTTTYKGIAHVYINAVSEFDFYPNPANNNINFTFNVNNDNAVTIELYDLTGRIVKNKSYTTVKGLNNKSLNVSDLPSGIYMLKAVVNNNQYIQKIVVN